jgi:hypothetical protein
MTDEMHGAGLHHGLRKSLMASGKLFKPSTTAIRMFPSMTPVKVIAAQIVGFLMAGSRVWAGDWFALRA